MKKITSLSLCILLIVALSSCSLQKRNYQPGYYISWNKSHNTGKISEKEISAIQKTESLQRIETQLTNASKPLSPNMGLVKIRHTSLHDPDNCDTLVLQNGTEVKAKVIEISRDEVKYKYCNNLNGPTIVVAKSDVKLIRYANGDKEEFAAQAKPSPLSGPEMIKDKYIQRQAQTALICGIASLFIVYFGIITAIIAIIKGSRAIRLIGKDRAQYMSYYKQARLGLMLGIVYFCLLAFLLLLLLAVAILVGAI